jgi:DNA-binding response OmpR family regulator
VTDAIARVARRVDRRDGQFFMTSSTSIPGAAAPTNGRAIRILVVDDHADTREGLRRMLQRSGHHAQGAGTCADALVAAAEMSVGRLDVVVSDIGLPDGDGVELMRTIMSRHACRAVALTGWGGVDDLKRYEEAGIDRSFIKPVAFSELLKALDALVGGG